MAKALGVGPEAVRELCRRGVLEHFRILNAIRIPRSEFERFVRENLTPRRARDAVVELDKLAPERSRRARPGGRLRSRK